MTWELVAGIISLLGLVLTYLLKQSDSKTYTKTIEDQTKRNGDLEKALLSKNKYIHELEAHIIQSGGRGDIVNRLNELYKNPGSREAGSV